MLFLKLTWNCEKFEHCSISAELGIRSFAQNHSFLRATVSDLLALLFKKSVMSDSLVIRANRSQKRAILSKKSYFFRFLTVFHCFSTVLSGSLLSHFAPSPFFKKQREPFALVTLSKSSILSESLPLLFKKVGPWAICSFSRVNRSFTHNKKVICLKNSLKSDTQTCTSACDFVLIRTIFTLKKRWKIILLNSSKMTHPYCSRSVVFPCLLLAEAGPLVTFYKFLCMAVHVSIPFLPYTFSFPIYFSVFQKKGIMPRYR